MKRMACAITLCLLVGGVAEATVYDIGDNLNNVSFDSSVDTLTNTGAITNWIDATLDFLDGSDLSDVDFTVLGIHSWTTAKFGDAASTIWDGANLSGIEITFATHNSGRRDSMVGTDFSGAIL